ncbi:hypothetical protein AVEN_55260-1 [Araneus ventricosus]|uniref:Uncharacterized protein n=1 Tax=Araneus ventricosus TaxID=182803 RepID=A0A4Y2U0K8_ARAVE|nr:hypothetical protein AVEN_55260-1 [Araneus ventricosus]
MELARELGEEVDDKFTIVNLKIVVLNSSDYEEEFSKEMLEAIIVRKQEKEVLEGQRETEEKDRQFEQEKEEKDRQFEMEKIKLQTSSETGSVTSESSEHNNKYNCVELQTVLQRFDSRNDDISLYLVIFERQANRLKINKADWVTQLMPLLPSDVVQIIAREPEKESSDYDYRQTRLKGEQESEIENISLIAGQK